MAVDISGQVALVTGASRGIGRECALALAREGANLALTARDEHKLEAVAAECGELGAKTLVVPADATHVAKLQHVVELTVDSLDGLDILVNNAGVFHHGFSDSADPAHWDEMLAINLRSVMHLTRLSLPHILAGIDAGRRGAVIFMASMSGKRTYPGGAGYCATKFGVLGFANALWDDLADRGLKISSICPGWVNTDMAEHSGLDTSQMIQPEDLAELVRMIATWPDTSCPREINVYPQKNMRAGMTD
jgi:NADP-dependent 3-hydroxy acid dehydrogenase YdfG